MFLPEGDLDLVLISPIGEGSNSDTYGMKLILHLLQSLCTHAVSANPAGSSCLGLATADSLSSYSIKNVEFVNARTKLVHCVVNTIGVDITVNQVGAVLAASFLEEVDQLVGHNHLFKRSLLLVKCWCYHESMKYAGVSILGSKYGFFSSYAVAVLLIHLFNKYHFNYHSAGSGSSWEGSSRVDENRENNDANMSVGGVSGSMGAFLGADCNLEGGVNAGGSSQSVTPHPFSYLVKFLEDYSKVSWSNNVVTVTQGVVPIQYGSTPVATEGVESVTNHFAALVEKYQTMSSAYSTARQQAAGTTPNPTTFILRLCNIQDPLDFNNNLGLAVTTTTLQLIDHALKSGCYHLQQLIIAEATLAQQRHNRKNQYFRAIPTPGTDGGAAEGASTPVTGPAPGDGTHGSPGSSDTASGKRRPNTGASEDERGKDTDTDEDVAGVARIRAATIALPEDSRSTVGSGFAPEVVVAEQLVLSPPQLPPTHPKPGHGSKPSRSRTLSGSYQGGSGAVKMPSLLEEFFPRSCITYFQGYFKLPEHHRPTLTQFLRKQKHQASLAKMAETEAVGDSANPRPHASNGTGSGTNSSPTHIDVYSACDGHVDEIEQFLTYMASIGSGTGTDTDNVVASEPVVLADSINQVTNTAPSTAGDVRSAPTSFLTAAKAASPPPVSKEGRSAANGSKSSSKPPRSKIKEPPVVGSLGVKSASFGAVDSVLTSSASEMEVVSRAPDALSASPIKVVSVRTVETGMQTEADADFPDSDSAGVCAAAPLPVPATPVHAHTRVSPAVEFSPATMSMISAEEGRLAYSTAEPPALSGSSTSTSTKSGGRRRNSGAGKQHASRGVGAIAGSGSGSAAKPTVTNSDDKTVPCALNSRSTWFTFQGFTGSTKTIGSMQILVLCTVLLLIIACLVNVPVLYASLSAAPDYAWGILKSNPTSVGTGAGDGVVAPRETDYNSSYISQLFTPSSAEGVSETPAAPVLEADGDCFGLGQCKHKKKPNVGPLVEVSSRVARRRHVEPGGADMGPEPLSKLSGQMDWFPMATHYVNSRAAVSLSPDDDLLKYLLDTALQNQAKGGVVTGSGNGGALGVREPEYDGYKKGRDRGASAGEGGDFAGPMSDPDGTSFAEQPSGRANRFQKVILVNDLFIFRWIKLRHDQTEQGSGVGKTREASGELLIESSSFLYNIPSTSHADTGIYVCYAIPLTSSGAGAERVMIAKSKVIVSSKFLFVCFVCFFVCFFDLSVCAVSNLIFLLMLLDCL